jgi:hypothetical protein
MCCLNGKHGDTLDDLTMLIVRREKEMDELERL